MSSKTTANARPAGTGSGASWFDEIGPAALRRRHPAARLVEVGCGREHGDRLEVGHLLPPAILEHREVRPRQPAHRLPVAVEYDDVDRDEIDPAAEALIGALRSLRGERRGEQQEEDGRDASH
jgi:hypothetical protein